MKHIRRQGGFAMIEGFIIAVIVIGLAGVGFWVVKQQSSKDDDQDGPNSSQTSDSKDAIEAPTAPQVETTADLNKMEQTLDDINLDVNESDNTELNAQSSAF